MSLTKDPNDLWDMPAAGADTGGLDQFAMGDIRSGLRNLLGQECFEGCPSCNHYYMLFCAEIHAMPTLAEKARQLSQELPLNQAEESPCEMDLSTMSLCEPYASVAFTMKHRVSWDHCFDDHGVFFCHVLRSESYFSIFFSISFDFSSLRHGQATLSAFASYRC